MATLQELLNAQSAVADRSRAKDWSARNRAAFGGILDVNQYLPVTGDIQSGILAAQDLGEGAYGSAALNALGLLPFVPAMGGVVKKAGKAAKTKYEIAQDVAQKNAALPISEGGLGLPANNTAMDRAKALGFDTKNIEYHTTDVENIPSIYEYGFMNVDKGKRNLKHLGPEYGGDRYYTTGQGNYTSNNPLASRITAQGQTGAKQVMFPLMINKSRHFDYKNPEHIQDLITPRENYAQGFGKAEINPKDLEALQEGRHYLMEDWITLMNLKKRGYTGTNLLEPPQYYGGEGITTNIFNPSDIRSIFAAFDPMRRKEADILAGIGGASLAGLLGLSLLDQQQYD